MAILSFVSYGVNMHSNETSLGLLLLGDERRIFGYFERRLFFCFCLSHSDRRSILYFIPLHEKFLQFDWLRAVVFQLNLKYLHVKITNPLWVVV